MKVINYKTTNLIETIEFNIKISVKGHKSEIEKVRVNKRIGSSSQNNKVRVDNE